MYRHPRDTIDELDEQIRATNLPPASKLLVVFGYPRSDIGKGTLVSHLLPLLGDANVIKFDGMLNTNRDGRFTASDHDDFGLYTAKNPHLEITQDNHLLGGDLIIDFVSKYGETNERLTLIPHLERFFRLELQQRWLKLGKPGTLVIEMGGSPDDTESDYALAAIRELKNQLRDQCQILLLTEEGHNNVFVKSKVAQRGVSELVSRGIVPDIIVAREPLLGRTISPGERLGFEIQMQERITERTGMRFNKIISMPYFANINAPDYGQFLAGNLLPYLTESDKHPEVLIGTTDEPEIQEWEMLLGGHFNLTDPNKLGLDIEVLTDDSSTKRISHSRARSYCRISGLPTVTAEAGLFINALDGRPGAGVRTWGGELATPMSNEELYNFMRSKVEALEDTSCYLEGSITIIMPNGEEHHLKTRDYGYIQKDNLARPFQPGQYPIGQVFKHKRYGRTWTEMTTDQRKEVRRERLERLFGVLRESVTAK